MEFGYALDTRVIAPLNEDPETLIREGLLRRDLYYRLNVIRIDFHAAAERKEDILYILKLSSGSGRKDGKKFCGLDKNSVEKLIKREYQERAGAAKPDRRERWL